MKTAKFRPCLSSNQIGHILSLCKKDLSDNSLSVISVLAPFKAKMENYGVAPSYVTQERQNIFDSLGIEEDSNATPEEKRQQAFIKWSEDPDSCTINELELVQTYRSENDLMSAEESERYYSEMTKKCEMS